MGTAYVLIIMAMSNHGSIALTKVHFDDYQSCHTAKTSWEKLYKESQTRPGIAMCTPKAVTPK